MVYIQSRDIEKQGLLGVSGFRHNMLSNIYQLSLASKPLTQKKQELEDLEERITGIPGGAIK